MNSRLPNATNVDKFQIELEKKKNTFDYPDALSDMRICTSSEEQLVLGFDFL
ncbi:6122_t:CDS:2 [Entrophospora sp. SA101]|nr:6122_t:CDS:2 [Entrophospora sp. SA101]